MGGPHTVVKNPSPDKKSWSANTGPGRRFFVVAFDLVMLISLYKRKHNKINHNKYPIIIIKLQFT
jgi:hypothetical protein